MRKAFLLLALLLAVSALSACAAMETTVVATATPSPEGKSFAFSIGGLTGTKSYTIDSSGLTLVITQTELDGTVTATNEYPWDKATWDAFTLEMLDCGVSQWDSDYTDPDVDDGTQWVLNMAGTFGRIHVSGSNAFPEQWDQFLGILYKYVGMTT
jgi:hypothetical protein